MALVTSIFNALTDSLNKKLRPVSFSLTADLVALQAVRFVPEADFDYFTNAIDSKCDGI
ncbi:hypothetical protein [Escherichia coli]|uniref:hypothetical protein n=1 Tax=Escherichia coli TaxID=562 RepID=UPI001298BE62|nr:hypothetical protein [Escherichia coli]MRD66088.1 hypothetical protein [Escherichia coli]HEI2696607.1 hypothetical protein [Escherichia coli]